jgi:hypothetical protein
MPDDALPREILRLVNPQQVRAYALAKGWLRVPGVNGDIALFNHPRAQWDQLLVPMDERFDDYDQRISDVIRTLAGFESRPATEVLNDVLALESDILRVRVTSAATGRGSVPLVEGINLLVGARKGLLAAACSVIHPATHHPRMSRTEALRLIGACQLGQTERGSFTVVVACPLRAVDPDQSLVPGAEPFARQTTSLLIRSLHRIIRAIDGSCRRGFRGEGGRTHREREPLRGSAPDAAYRGALDPRDLDVVGDHPTAAGADARRRADQVRAFSDY